MKVAFIRPGVDFDEAFAAARDAGVDQFHWRDRRYTTKRTDDPLPELPVITCILDF